MPELAPCCQSFSEGIQYSKPETANLTKQKMDHERWRYENAVHKIDINSKIAEEICSKNVQQAKDDHLKTLAYARVYQLHSFDKYDPFKDDPLEGKAKRRKRKRKQKPRPNTFQTIANPEKDDPETLLSLSPQRSTLTIAALNRTFPQISTMEPVEKETDNKSLSNSHYNALCLWKSATKKLFMKEKKVKAHKEPQLTMKAKAKLEVERPQRKNIFPGECKTQAALRRFMEHETELVMQEMTAPKHKKDESIRKMVERAQLPDIIRRDKSFSAIVKDFKTYKEEKEERRHRKMIEYVTHHFNQNSILH